MTLSEFAPIAGMNLGETLERFVDDEAFLTESLQDFLSDDTMSLLVQAWESQDSDALIKAVHTLKGIAGNLGLGNLHTACQQLLRHLREAGLSGAEEWYQAVCSSHALATKAIPDIAG